MSQRLKSSQFNVLVPHGDALIIYNTMTKALVSLSRESYETLEKLSFPIPPVNRITQSVLASVETLKEQGILVSAGEDETQKALQWYDKVRFDKSCLRLSVLTTYNCNFACVYCIENGVKNLVQMDEGNTSITLAWIKKRALSLNVSNLFVLFYGGEPLLNTKPMYHLAENLHRFTQEHAIALQFAITTNGYLLSEEIVEQLLPYGLSSLTVTLDGSREAHDKKRPHVSGKGTFDRIIQNILSVAPQVRVNLGVNVDSENIDSLPGLMNFLEKTHLKELIHTIDVNPIMPTMSGGVSSHPCSQGEPNDANLLSRIITQKEQMLACGFPIANKLKHVMCGMKQDGGLLVIDPEGKIYTCPAFVGREEFAIGSLEGQELSNKHQEMVHQPPLANCLSCAYFPMCSGGCPYDAYVKTGDYYAPVCHKETLEQWVKSLIQLQYMALQKKTT